ncbi:vanadium-dependent haloperoxidase [Caldimonas sp. KR1-144]|uniref:vanadium-dependent haloperoxidase n=1 Tax=Caldimonas sp. KR1-144 TaxID=3400911 RepID=UPI003C07D721
MKTYPRTQAIGCVFAALVMTAFMPDAQADAITDWNVVSAGIVSEAKIGTPPAIRVMAIVQTAAHEAVLAAGSAPARATADAAVAAAHRAAFAALLPAQAASVDAAYRAALEPIVDGADKRAGIALGERAAAAVLARRAADLKMPAEAYRPHAAPGVYVPTALPAVPQWPARQPWLMRDPAQFRPAPPPALDSAAWARDFNEVKAMGGKQSARRSAEQTEVARFWEYSLPAIYHGVVRSVAAQPGRDLAGNARLFAAVAQAMDDAMIAVADAKYHYHFWRPVTAIRNGDADGNDATERDATWVSFIDAPMHPEYPSAHSVLAGAVGSVLAAEVGAGPMPELSTSSPTAQGATRRWTRLEDFLQEVANARVWEGIHYRSSTEVGTALGRQVGELAVQRLQLASNR